jgi:hypothetical protein
MKSPQFVQPISENCEGESNESGALAAIQKFLRLAFLRLDSSD